VKHSPARFRSTIFLESLLEQAGPLPGVAMMIQVSIAPHRAIFPAAPRCPPRRSALHGGRPATPQSLAGTVKDPSGAVIARAQVTLYSDGQLAQITNRWSVTFSGREELLVTVQGRVASNEYDDDQNQLPLGGNFCLKRYSLASAAQGFTVFVAGENLTNQSYEIARTPVVNVGQPITGRIGVRWQSPR